VRACVLMRGNFSLLMLQKVVTFLDITKSASSGRV